MSMLLMVKAMQCKVGNPARKLVLLKLADNANDEGTCFPSYQYIADQCEISKRSAITHIEALINDGFVSKTLRKNKDGSSSNLYQLHLDGSENSALEGVKKLHHPGENISLPPSENISPITSHSINQSVNHKKTTQKKSPILELLAEFGIAGQLAEDFITHRKAKTAPITRTALERLQKQADLAKLPLAEVAEVMIEQGWRGFKADWLTNTNSRQSKSKIATFTERNNDTTWFAELQDEIARGEAW